MPSAKTALDPAIPKQRRWDWRYLDLASVVSRWSKDPRAQVGAIIVNGNLGRIIAIGFNGFPTNITDCATVLADKDKKLRKIIHAEQNALLFAGRDARGCDLYVVGKPICNRCAVLAIQAGIGRVIALTPDPDSDREGEKAGRLACNLLDEAVLPFVPHAQIGWTNPTFESRDPDLIRPTPRSAPSHPH
jgi:dCMP deaminase